MSEQISVHPPDPVARLLEEVRNPVQCIHPENPELSPNLELPEAELCGAPKAEGANSEFRLTELRICHSSLPLTQCAEPTRAWRTS